ncbi:phosphopantothenoylcysteine decarboxylase isoform X2 [Melospiza melodia melodia]|uniref:phosphopantothenoylcysteine decarboxylase isoform X2 n=1 Tax=Melospiza georgiana TaxID=44398 RepID=UPI0025AC792E|nr:phosphopantothenoylcysteine decarboxylase isoform X2 [Melospiza georgiana]
MEPISLPEPGIPAGSSSSSVAQGKFHVLLGVTGSVAALKLPLLVAELLKIPALEVKVVTTERAKHFYNAQEIPVALYGDEEEWQLWKGRSDPVLHIELRRWADLMVVAPLDANTLAKVANGICDNLLLALLQPGLLPGAGWDLSSAWPPSSFLPVRDELGWNVLQIHPSPCVGKEMKFSKMFNYSSVMSCV